ncbi:MAG: ammonia-dependent NAD(+) synthetase [Bacillaceae bacterium]
MLQKEIIKELGVQPTINPEETIQFIVNNLKEYMETVPFIKSLVLGISGGQDSCLVGKIAQMAIDQLNEENHTNEYKFIAMRLPYGVQADEEDCQIALQFIHPSETITVNIKPSVDASVASYYEATGKAPSDFVKGNEKARERMKAQYLVAAENSGLVLGTDHAAEALTGFYTKWGDGACDYAPITFLNKRQGRELLKYLECPEVIYTKKPTADLEDNKPQLPDEVALGVTYDQIDDYLEGKEIEAAAKEKLEGIYLKTRHKRNPIITSLDNWWRE